MTTKPRPDLAAMITRADGLGRYRPILAGYSEGAFNLPPALINDALRLQRIDQALIDHKAPQPRAESELAEQILEAGHREKPEWPTAESIFEERRQAEAHQLLATALTSARTQAAHALYRRFTGPALDHILTDYLRPAHDEVIKKARSIVGNFQKAAGLTENQILQADAPVRSAVVDMRDLAARYSRIRAAFGTITRGRVEYDDRGSFAHAPNYLQSIGFDPAETYAPPQQMPAEPLERLVYLAANRDLEPWLPLPQEQDTAWLRFYGPSLPDLHPLKGKTTAA